MTVKGNHKLAEIIACKLSGIESVPIKHVGKMVNNACRAAVEYHEAARREERETWQGIINQVITLSDDPENLSRLFRDVIRKRGE